MKVKTKKDLNAIVDDMVIEYNKAESDEKGKVLANLIKGVNVIKEVEGQDIDNQIKKKRIRLDEEKLELEKRRMEIEEEKLRLDREKLEIDQSKFNATTNNDIRKLELEDSKLEFEKKRFKIELNKSKTDKIFNGVMKGLEIGLPLIIYGGLSVLSLKAIYKDDVRVPSETWNFIRGVSKK
jgi:hypothetical protein